MTLTIHHVQDRREKPIMRDCYQVTVGEQAVARFDTGEEARAFTAGLALGVNSTMNDWDEGHQALYSACLKYVHTVDAGGYRQGTIYQQMKAAIEKARAP